MTGINKATLDEISGIVAQTQKLVAFSGAGISAESGIPTFRDPGGLWDKLDVEMFGTLDGLAQAFASRPAFVAEALKGILHSLENAGPNPGHTALAELESMGFLRTVITQNGDNLHQDAGNRNVIELHGNFYRYACISCGERHWIGSKKVFQLGREVIDIMETADRVDLTMLLAKLPACSCGNLCRPDVVAFGEQVQYLDKARQEALDCEVMLVLGTSGVVYPAAMLPDLAKSKGAVVVEVNPNENCFSRIADYYIPEKSGSFLPELIKSVRQRYN